ncbi:MAG: Maf family nucleotide pyrophosphatase [Bacteroidota bacterium]
MDALNHKIILGSQSPRRKQLLEQAGFSFEIRTNPIDESFPDNMPVEAVAQYLAEQKAEAAKHLLENEDEILLTADSVVILKGKIYGKPENPEDAKRIIRELSGETHEVVTGVCLLSKDKKKSFSGSSKVIMKQLTEEEIDFYIENYKPFDKAGSYGIQEWIGLCKISRIEGTYANIMGLPVDLVYQHLQDF